MPTASSIEFSSRRAIRRTRRKEHDFESDPDQPDADRGDDKTKRERPMIFAIDVIDGETADHEHLPVGEVQDVHDAEDQRDAERDQRVGRGQDQALKRICVIGTLAASLLAALPLRLAIPRCR